MAHHHGLVVAMAKWPVINNNEKLMKATKIIMKMKYQRNGVNESNGNNVINCNMLKEAQ